MAKNIAERENIVILTDAISRRHWPAV